MTIWNFSGVNDPTEISDETFEVWQNLVIS
jgi:hypothetical protein